MLAIINNFTCPRIKQKFGVIAPEDVEENLPYTIKNSLNNLGP